MNKKRRAYANEEWWKQKLAFSNWLIVQTQCYVNPIPGDILHLVFLCLHSLSLYADPLSCVFLRKNFFFPRVDFVCWFHIEFNLLSLRVIVYAYGLYVCLSELGQPLPPPSRAYVGAVFDFVAFVRLHLFVWMPFKKM